MTLQATVISEQLPLHTPSLQINRTTVRLSTAYIPRSGVEMARGRQYTISISQDDGNTRALSP